MSTAPAITPPAPAFLRRFFRRDRFAAGAGIRLVEVRPGYALARMRVRPGHMNGVDVVQGGAVFTLADLAFAVACNTQGPVALAINVSISFLRAVTGGTLTAEAREVKRTSRLSTVEVEVRDRAGDLVALFHGTAYVTRDSLAAVAARPRPPAAVRTRGADRAGAGHPERRPPGRERTGRSAGSRPAPSHGGASTRA